MPYILYLPKISYELQPKFTAMESSIRGVSIFWKLSWGLENDNTLFKNDNVCLCWSWSSVILCLTAQVIQCISYERSKRQNLFFFINRCVERLQGKNKQVSVPGFFAAVCTACWISLKHCAATCPCISFSTAASSFPQDNTTTFQTKGFHRFLQNHCFICIYLCIFFWIQPGVPNDNPNDNETITKKSQNPYRPDTGPFARWKPVFLGACCSSKMSKQAQDMAGLRCFLNELLQHEGAIFLSLKYRLYNRRKLRSQIPDKMDR